jgi:hypothetical protein
VQEEQRLALSVYLVVVVDAVRGDVALLERHELARRFLLCLGETRRQDEGERGCKSL